MAKNIINATSMLGRIVDYTKPLRVFECNVPEDWTDFNGHMNEARYLDCFSNASDAILQMMGCDETYIANGKSFFTVETHILHLDEVRANALVYVTTQILLASAKKLHLFHSLYHEESDRQQNRLLATGEQMLLHVDLDSRRTCDTDGELARKMQRYANAHSGLPQPQGVGRAIGQK